LTGGPAEKPMSAGDVALLAGFVLAYSLVS
jgi:hypothetical protein